MTLALTQDNDRIKLPVITAQLSAIGEDKLLSSPSEIPEISLIGPDFISPGTVPVTINLKVGKGNNLLVELFMDNELRKKEGFRITKEDFAYKFTPEQGLNKLVFTVRDENGNVNQQEVTVLYQPMAIGEPIVEGEELKELPSNLNGFAEISDNKLRNYINSLDDFEYLSLSELYRKLIDGTTENGYTDKEVEDLFAIILTQRNKNEFIDNLATNLNLDEFDESGNIISNTELPLLIIRKLKVANNNKIQFLDSQLIDLIPVNYETKRLFEYVLSFSTFDSVQAIRDIEIGNNNLILSKVVGVLGSGETSSLIDKAATTRELNQYFNNLLMSSGPELKPILSVINFDSLSIDNAIELVNYLFDQAENGEIDYNVLVEELENACKEENKNILLFKNSLANAATGELKMDIQELEPIDKNLNGELIGILEALLKNTPTKGYSIAEVYDLILNMIEITGVDEFIREMQKFTSGDLDSLLVNIDQKKFSVPLEVIQYLLSESAYYDYSETDINNLLIRMLLEKGFKGSGILKGSEYTEKLIKKKRFITTIVLINIFLFIIILLFWRQKKKKNE